MALINEHFLKLQNNYLFSDIAKKVNSFKVTHPKKKIIRMGIGDVTQPLAPAVIEAMHKADDEMASKDTFHGYGPEQGLSVPDRCHHQERLCQSRHLPRTRRSVRERRSQKRLWKHR